MREVAVCIPCNAHDRHVRKLRYQQKMCLGVQWYLKSLEASSTTRTSAASDNSVYAQKPIWRGCVHPYSGSGPLVEIDGHHRRSLSMMLTPAKATCRFKLLKCLELQLHTFLCASDSKACPCELTKTSCSSVKESHHTYLCLGCYLRKHTYTYVTCRYALMCTRENKGWQQCSKCVDLPTVDTLRSLATSLVMEASTGSSG